jgi:hypothetical protein
LKKNDCISLFSYGLPNSLPKNILHRMINFDVSKISKLIPSHMSLLVFGNNNVVNASEGIICKNRITFLTDEYSSRKTNMSLEYFTKNKINKKSNIADETTHYEESDSMRINKPEIYFKNKKKWYCNIDPKEINEDIFFVICNPHLFFDKSVILNNMSTNSFSFDFSFNKKISIINNVKSLECVIDKNYNNLNKNMTSFEIFEYDCYEQKRSINNLPNKLVLLRDDTENIKCDVDYLPSSLTSLQMNIYRKTKIYNLPQKINKITLMAQIIEKTKNRLKKKLVILIVPECEYCCGSSNIITNRHAFVMPTYCNKECDRHKSQSGIYDVAHYGSDDDDFDYAAHYGSILMMMILIMLVTIINMVIKPKN